MMYIEGAYSGEVLGDVDLIWSNCRSFNEADSDICDLADQAQQALRMRWHQEGLPTVAPLPPSAKKKKQKRDSKKAVLEAGEPCDTAHREGQVCLLLAVGRCQYVTLISRVHVIPS